MRDGQEHHAENAEPRGGLLWRPITRTEWRGLVAGCVVACAIVVPVEIARLRTAPLSGLAAWMATFNVDSSPFLPWLAAGLAILALRWLRRDARAGQPRPLPPLQGHRAGPCLRPRTAMALVAATALASACYVGSRPVAPDGRRFASLPPAYHDEYSYLFQARTFLAGRWYFPSARKHRELFDQMHVLNEGRFASRYFPGTGLWLAPWVAIGRPVWGQYLAGVLASVFVFLAAREVGGDVVGLASGLAFGLAPGVALFGNLLLAHHPTLVGLTLFLWAFLRMQSAGDWRWAAVAGCGLAWAMLCRPMTAAAFGLPFGAWFLSVGVRSAWRDRADRPLRAWLVSATAMAVPLALGLSVLGIQNKAITGSVLRTPYQLYTDTYTPRHVYGFYNVTRGERRLGPRVLENYDRWAEELTPALAVRNVLHRWLASWQWSFGVVPLTIALSVSLSLLAGACGDDRVRRGVGWLLASVATLHAAHVPYWFSGILHHHYVFESVVAWSIIIGLVTVRLFSVRRVERRWDVPAWWAAGLALVWATQYMPLDPLWPVSRVDAAVAEIGFSRLRYARFHELIAREVKHRPALVLVIPDPADRHIDYVNNPPSLDAEVLIGRWPADVKDAGAWLREIARAFPERHLYVFDARQWRVSDARDVIAAGGRRGADE